ncbi:hypothetical protein F5050DRAFT_1804256 [Lentinula boryana]|uniref:XRRM domain-containing protein n=1 Tax=Lentinula boryana TaxID=40481 RepID=A0ABQ8QP92_9AGAR|nr:hypothetical protein F5050DRAFT_1804256 [Lentinula boryana]
MPFTFIPRNVGKKTQTSSSIPTSAAGSHFISKGKRPAVDSLPRNPSIPNSVPTSHTDESSVPAEEIAILVALSLTGYTLWANGDLRRRIEQTTEGESGFLPLRYILKHSPLIQDQQHYPQLKILSESAIVKALRKHTEDEVEVRMVLSGPAWSNWGSSSANTDQGMYEVRSRTTANQISEGAEAYTRGFWAKRTVYIENIPPAYRTMHGVFQFVRNTYPSGNPKIQGVSFPQHHLDIDPDSTSLPLSSKSKSRPRCKGFAFVVFSSLNEVEHFCTMWNWKRSRSESVKVEMEPSILASTFKAPSNAEVIADAQKHGFRALLKAKWDVLKDEYLARRQNLLEQVLAEQDNQGEVALDHEREEETEDDDDPHSVQSDVSSTSSSNIFASLTPLSPYPPNCLVFIRNIHMGTNKTTLRTLFVKALTSERAQRVTQPQDVSQTQYIDYVDYTKGMNTCHVRFSSPSQASALQSYFTSHHIVQNMALDDTGVHTEAQEAGIEVEVVKGKKEEIYWEKVPIKVRQEAVRKVLSLANAASCYSSSALFSGSSESALLTNTKPTSNSVLHSASSSLFSSPTSQSDPHPPPYPLNCLLFIRNVNSGTNKTTLRTFFANILLQQGESSNTGNDVKLGSQSAIDYVDYTKGTDSCHLRLASPSNARFLVEYFTKRSVVQNAPLDDDGSVLTRSGGSGGASSQHIIVELVQGTREKVYWEKVPLKVRQEAVRRVVSDVPEPFVTSFPSPHSEPSLMVSKPSKKREFAGAGNMDQDNGGSPLSDGASNIADRKRRKKR